MADLYVKGMELSSNVLETIVSLAVSEVPGVAAVADSQTTGFFRKVSTPAVEAFELDDETLLVSVHIIALHGYVLPDVAQAVRQAVSDAVSTQLGVAVSAVDVCIDALRFA